MRLFCDNASYSHRADLSAAGVILLALYETVSLNTNFLTILTHTSAARTKVDWLLTCRTTLLTAQVLSPVRASAAPSGAIEQFIPPH